MAEKKIVCRPKTTWLRVTLNDINKHSDVQASSHLNYLVKNNKITVEEQDTDKLETLCSEKKPYGQKWLTTLCVQADECALYIYIYIYINYLCYSNWDRGIAK